MKRWIGRLLMLLVALNVAVAAGLLVLKKRIPSRGDEESDDLELATIMDGLKLVSHAEAFRGGSALTLAGGSMIDLREATLAPGGADLELKTIMGGTAVLIPEGWRAEVQAASLMGGVKNRAEEGQDSLPDDAPTLRVKALALMGGIEVAHKPSVDLDGIAEMAQEDEPEVALEAVPAEI